MRERVRMEADAIAITPWLARVGFNGRYVGEARAGQCFGEDRLLYRKLERIRGVLILAAAAATVKRAGRGGALRRGREHLQQCGFGEAAAVARRRGLHDFTGQRHGNEHGFALVAREARAAVDGFFDGEPHAPPRM